MTTLTLSEIYIYPIKSLGGIRVGASRVLPKGLEYDRRWMLIDQSDRFMTQRLNPDMALLKVSLSPEQLIVTDSRNGNQVVIPITPLGMSAQGFPSPERDAIVWNDTVRTTEVSTEVSQWFSDALKVQCRLVMFPEHQSRQVDQHYAESGQHVSLADGFPFLLISQESLDDLNSRLNVPVTMNRFRPNFVICGGSAYDEDHWTEFSIGKVRFRSAKLCARCVLTTVDQATAIRSPEPLRTLSAYRHQEAGVMFGQNLLAVGQPDLSWFVSEGDPVTRAT